MTDKTTVVLLIEDDPADAKLILDALSGEVDSPFRVEWATLLSAGLERLSKEGVDVVMLDLSLPDVQGIAAVDQVCLAAPDLLVLVLSGLTDEEVARQALQCGAYDYFSKGTSTPTGSRGPCVTSSPASWPWMRWQSVKPAPGR